MAISIKCPNGHKLTAKKSNAGKTGKCPVCKCAIEIPAIPGMKQNVLTESAVLDIIGDPDPTTSVFAVKDTLFTADLVTETQEKTPPPKDRPAVSTPPPSSTKTCDNCERDIDARYNICPHCHTYLRGNL